MCTSDGKEVIDVFERPDPGQDRYGMQKKPSCPWRGAQQHNSTTAGQNLEFERLCNYIAEILRNVTLNSNTCIFIWMRKALQASSSSEPIRCSTLRDISSFRYLAKVWPPTRQITTILRHPSGKEGCRFPWMRWVFKCDKSANKGNQREERRFNVRNG